MCGFTQVCSIFTLIVEQIKLQCLYSVSRTSKKHEIRVLLHVYVYIKNKYIA